MGGCSFSGDLVVNDANEILLESLKQVNALSDQCYHEIESWGDYEPDAVMKSPSSLDACDYVFSIAIGMAGAYITTNQKLEEYLADIHKAASGASGDYTKLQEFLGSLLKHQGDAIDKKPSEKHFINRDALPADIGFHRLLWGHDIFDVGPDNPFKLMFEQKGLYGILQAARHLIADTMSKQGLPIPGSSHLDYYNDDGNLSNYLIKISKQLSAESIGKMSNAQNIYSHMFTVRSQDILGGGAITGLDALYFKVRGIEDKIRMVQFRLISYTVAFYGQAIIGMIRQSGVPYINIPLSLTMFKTLVQLYYFNIKDIRKLHERTYELIDQGGVLFYEVAKTGEGIEPYNAVEEYIKELSEEKKKADSLIGFFESGE